MTQFARLLALFSLAILAACTKPVVWAPEEDVIAARYHHDGPTEIVLFNVISNDRDRGEHAALMINAFPKAKVLLGDRGYDAKWVRDALAERNITSASPPR